MYRNAVRHVIGWRFAAVLVFFAALGLTYWIYNKVPRAFIPEDDQGYIIFIVQAPQGASLAVHGRRFAPKWKQVLSHVPEIAGAFSLPGFSQFGNAPNRAMVFSNLKPFEERKGEEHSAQAIIQRLRGRLFGIQGALVIPVQSAGGAGIGAIRRISV